jgi:Putative adhesin
MPTFATPGPIHVAVEASGGDVRITASERTDTVVTVTPRTPGRAADIRAAEQVRIDLSGDVLTVKGLKSWRQISPFGGHGLADITIELPRRSDISATTAVGAIVTDGELGRVNAKSAMGDIAVDHMATGRARTALGDVQIDRVDGDLDAGTSSGELRIGDVHGSATVKSSNGNISLHHVTGDLKVKAANGRIDVERVDRSVVSKTANGSTRIGQVGEGDVLLTAASGGMQIGIPLGTTAWLDLHSQFGRVSNELEITGQPSAADRRVKVTAKTYNGDVVVHRADPVPAAIEQRVARPALEGPQDR